MSQFDDYDYPPVIEPCTFCGEVDCTCEEDDEPWPGTDADDHDFFPPDLHED